MKLYSKQLGNTRELQEEKKKLLKKRRYLSEQEFLSLDVLLDNRKSKKKKKRKKQSNSSLLELFNLPPVVSLLLKGLEMRAASKSSKTTKSFFAGTPDRGKSMLKSIAIEFIGGYLKWKAIELSYKGIKYLIKSRQQNKPQPGNQQNKPQPGRYNRQAK